MNQVMTVPCLTCRELVTVSGPGRLRHRGRHHHVWCTPWWARALRKR